MLQLVRPLPETPWHQLPEEPEAEYAMFLLWLTKKDRPGPYSVHTAEKYAWSRRAKAYDDWIAVPKTQKDSFQAIVGTITEIARISANNQIKAIRAGESPGVSFRDLQEFAKWHLSVEPIMAVLNKPEEEIDWSQLSKDELRAFEKLNRMLERVG